MTTRVRNFWEQGRRRRRRRRNRGRRRRRGRRRDNGPVKWDQNFLPGRRHCKDFREETDVYLQHLKK